MLDIIILLVLAWFVLSRYKKTLGMKMDDEGDAPRRQNPLRPARRDENADIYQRNADRMRAAPVVENDGPALADISNPSVSKGLMEIKAADPSFNARDFTLGARSAFEMILQAFAKGDRDTLKSLLSAEIYEDFEQEITDRETREVSEEVTLVAIRQADITAASVRGKHAEISVQFVTEQIVVDRDKEGNIVGGDASSSVQVSDEWTFTRDTRSNNPNWTLIAT